MQVRSGSEVHLDEWVSPDVTDGNGLLQTGKLLEWMDVIGVVAATRHCRQPVVTASIDGMELREPVRLGDRVSMTARVAYTSTHSVGVSVTTTTVRAGVETERPTLEAYMTFVPLDRRGRPLEVPRFVPDSPDEQARFHEGEQRRAFRRKLESGELGFEGERPAPNEMAAHEWPMFLRAWMSRLPRHLQLPWARNGRAQRRQRSYIHKIEPVRLGALNFHGTAYGGTMMVWSEVSANLSARAYADGAAMRCTGLHGLNFLRPVERDRFVHIRSVVVHTSGTSLTVLVSVTSEDAVQGSQLENLRAFFTYAPLDPWTRIAPVEQENDEERALFEEVELRLALQRTLHRSDLV